MRNFKSLLLMVWLYLAGIALLSGCTRTQLHSSEPWKFTQVRLVDALDAPASDLDITVISARAVSDRLEFRMELLDVPDLASADIWVILSPQSTSAVWSDEFLSRPGLSSNRDCLILFAANGDHRAWDAAGTPVRSARLRVSRNPVLDLIDLSVHKPCGNHPGSNLNFSIGLVKTGSAIAADQAGPANLSALPPGKTGVLLALWNTFPATSPSAALRAWDGAHGGYFGERHGLANFLAAAMDFKFPFFLLDLKTPESLAAMDYSAALEPVQSLARAGRLLIPQTALPPLTSPIDRPSYDRMLADSRQAGLDFGLHPSQIAFLPEINGFDALPDNYRAIFYTTPSPESNPASAILATRFTGGLLLRLPETPLDQINREGLSLRARRQLLSALNPQAVPLQSFVLLGGDFNRSAWSDERSIRAALEYLAVRPWITFLDEADLLTLPGHKPDGEMSVTASSAPSPQWSPAEYSETAWLAYRANQLPVGLPLDLLASLRQIYNWLPESLEQVASWAAAPASTSACLEKDSGTSPTTCLLSSPTVIALIDPYQAGVYLLAAAIPDQNSLTNIDYAQIVGSSAQLISGLSDPSDWNLAAGSFADPMVIPGGFARSAKPDSIQVSQSGLTISGSPNLHFALLADGLRIESQVSSGSLYETSVPLIFQPEQRFHPDWAANFAVNSIPGGYMITWGGKSQVTVTSNADLRVSSFNDSSDLVGGPENPDYEYPPGHFLPFPLIKLDLAASSDFFVEIRLTAGLPQASR